MQMLSDLIKNNQSFLIKRTLEYAKLHNYTKYTSTLEEAWVASITGLSTALLNASSINPQVPEIEVDHDFVHNSMVSFGIKEAQKHRQRGVTLEMFLGLMKYYRQTYLDLIMQSIQDQEQRHLYMLWVTRFFDHNEISFCSEWTAQTKQTIISELQVTNRNLTNEKNKYVTIFESIPNPAILLDDENRCININYAAHQLFQENHQSPGYIYYSTLSLQPQLKDLLPWLNAEFMDFYQGDALEFSLEKDFGLPNQEKRNYIIKFHRMLDVSDKFEGTIILFNDITERKKIEEQLLHISFHDILTGLYNRNYMEQELIRVSTGQYNPVGFISIDIDGLKLVNDNYGHDAGDTLLITVAQIIKKCFRDSDIVARIGGDEFAALMPLSDAIVVQNVCRKIYEEVAEHNLVNLTIPVSISIGWSVGNPSVMGSINEIIKDADRMMYVEKQGNRLKYSTLFGERSKEYGQTLFKPVT
jgi:diguanylate cyclase